MSKPVLSNRDKEFCNHIKKLKRQMELILIIIINFNEYYCYNIS